MKPEPQPSELLRQAVVHLRRAAIATPKVLPIAEELERMAARQEEYENAQVRR